GSWGVTCGFPGIFEFIRHSFRKKSLVGILHATRSSPSGNLPSFLRSCGYRQAAFRALGEGKLTRYNSGNERNVRSPRKREQIRFSEEAARIEEHAVRVQLYQPVSTPFFAFCSSSHFCRGAK